MAPSKFLFVLHTSLLVDIFQMCLKMRRLILNMKPQKCFPIDRAYTTPIKYSRELKQLEVNGTGNSHNNMLVIFL